MVSTSGSGSQLSVERCDLGESYQFKIAKCNFKLRNNGDRSLHIENIKSAASGDKVSTESLDIPAHEERQITFAANVGNRLGPLIRFVTFDVDGEPRRLIASGFVLSDLDNGAQRIDFGNVDATNGSVRKVIELSSHEIADFRIVDISETPSWIEARIGPDNRTVSARVIPGAAWAPNEGYIKLKINTPHQQEAWIPATANVQGDVIPSANPFEIGAVHEGSTIEFVVRLTSRDGKPFKLGKISSNGVSAEVAVESCAPVSKDCRQLKARLPDNLPLGIFRGEILVELPEHGKKLPITFGGLLVAKTSEIRKAPDSSVANSGVSDGAKDKGSAELLPSTPQPDLTGLLRDAALQARAQSALKPPPGAGPLLKWQVANEQQVYGYLINRSDSEKGPFVRVNRDVIKAVSSGSGWTYQWRDDAATGGKNYWYYISIINKLGQVEQLSGAQKILAR